MKIPAGYVAIPIRSPYTRALGTVYMRGHGKRRRFGLWVGSRHVNLRGHAHGGFLMTVADVALSWGHGLRAAHVPRITVSMNCDFVGTAERGDWLEVDVELQKLGHTLVFVHGNLRVKNKPVAHASAVLRVTPTPRPTSVPRRSAGKRTTTR